MKNLEIGRILGNAVEMYRKHWEVLISLSASINLVAAVLVAAALSIFKTNILVGLGVGVISGVVMACANLVLQGMYVLAVDDLRDGKQDVGFAELYERALPRFLPLLLTTVLAGIAMVFGFIMLVIPGFIVMTFLYVTSSVVMIERKPYFAALSRSWELVRGRGLTVFGILFVTSCLTAIAAWGLGKVVGHYASGDFATILVKQLPAVITGPFAAMVPVLTYFDLRGDTRTGEVPAAAPATAATA
jgi:hypothetical protein